MKKNRIHPPRWANRFLEWYCRADLLEDLQGDLHEYFERNVATKGIRKARLRYVFDVIKFFKPYTVKKFEILDQLTQLVMFKNYFKTSVRSIVRNKLFSAINVIGLAISITICLLSISFIAELNSYDKFNEKRDRIFRLTSNYQSGGNPVFNLASSSIFAGKKIAADFPVIEDHVILTYGFGGNFSQQGKSHVQLEGHWASSKFFNVFSYNLIQGNPETALSEPNSLVLTTEAAINIFGRTDVLNETVKLDDQNEYLITGIMENVPNNSHLQFDLLCSFKTKEIEERNNDGFESWASLFTNYVYFALSEEHDLEELETQLTELSIQENAKITNREIFLGLQPLNQIAVGTPLMNGIGFSIDKKTMFMVIGLTLIIVLSACFNYTNLSIARSLKRAREIGVRKTHGATKIHIFTQFLTEAIIISLIALGIAYLLFELLKSDVLSFDPELQQAIRFQTSPQLMAYFVVSAIVIGIIAGAFPALILSKINTLEAIKGVLKQKSSSSINMKKALLVIQYTFSLGFIIAATISFSQFKYALEYDLGYQTDNIVNIPLQGNDYQTVINQFSKIPGVNGISKSWLVLGTGRYVNEYGMYTNPQDSAKVSYNFVDENYLALHDYVFLAGENFRKDDLARDGKVIVNETLLNRFGIGSPSEAIGETFTFSGEKYRIGGVVKDFNFLSLSETIQPFVFRTGDSLKNLPWIVNLKINSEDLAGTMQKVESAWNNVDDVNPMEAEFYSNQIKATYLNFFSLFKIVSGLAIVAISIATLGLLGMAVYMAETKQKETSIRKILGASANHLIFNLSKGLVIPLIIASLIAIPVTYWIFEKYVLVEIAFRANVGIVELFSGVLVIFMIGFITIASQVVKSLRSNPTETLRLE